MSNLFRKYTEDTYIDNEFDRLYNMCVFTIKEDGYIK